MLLHLAVASAAPTLEVDGDSLFDPCLADPDCEAAWRPVLNETLLETGYALAHEPMMTSAFGGRGSGVVTELEVRTATLGPRNDLETLLPAVPAVPSVALGYHVGSYTYETPYPQYTIGVHGLFPLRLGDLRVGSLGATASAAFPLHRLVWVGAEATFTSAWFSAPMSAEVSTLEVLEGFVVPDPSCDAPCVDRFAQHTPSGRLAVSLEPLPALFAWGKVGVTAFAQSLGLAVDDTTWRWTPVLPELGAGAGVRAGDRFQLGGGVTAALRPAAATTDRHRWMTRVLFTSGFRFGAVRYHETDEAPGTAVPPG